MIRIATAGPGIVLMVLAASFATAETTDPAIASDEIRQIGIDPTSAVEISDFSLRAGAAKVVLADGVLVPSTTVAGRAVEFVFLGDGHIELEAPDDIEAGQLDLFTGSENLHESFHRAVFVIALDAAADAISTRSASTDEGGFDEAADLFGVWLTSPERRLLDVEARIFADALGDRLAAGFFCGYFEGRELGRFLYVVDPLAQEQVTLGQFVQADLSKRDERRTHRSIRKAQRQGKLIGLEVSDLGTWDTWVSTSLHGSDGAPTPGARGVEPEHYAIEAVLEGRDLDLEARVRMDLSVVVDGIRVAALEMAFDLQPVSVTDSDGRPVDWFRSRNELVVVLAEPARLGEKLSISIDYTGKPINKVASGAFVLRSTTAWYPHAGTIDRATYDVTIHRPEKLDVVAPGTRSFGGRSGEDTAWGRWRLERPSMGFSFEIGRYEFASGWAGDVGVSVAVDRLGQKAGDDLAGEILATTIDVMESYAEIYGPYPLRRLQVVSSPRGFSQGLLGFVSLATGAVIDWDVWGEMLGTEDRRTVIAHEVAHQWWGNQVGWRSYRDQWISEAMATYSALLFARTHLSSDRDARTWRGPTADWDRALIRSHVGGRRIESLGPLVLGVRLDSSISDRAYSAIIYKKGALVLNMLSRFFGDESFLEMLREIISRAAFRVISTEEFLGMIEQLAETDLTWFRNQYVDGTGLPVSRFSYRFEELTGGRWAVVGEARQLPLRDERFAVVETSLGTFDVHRSFETRLDPADAIVVVPVQVGVTDTTDEGGGQRRIFSGQVLVAGGVSPFRLELGLEPEIFFVDRDAEVFGRFYNELRWPRRNGLYRGREVAAAGDAEAALATFREALSAPVAVIPEHWRDGVRRFDPDDEGRAIDAHIRLEVTRIHLDEERVTEAVRELELAEDLIRGSDRWDLAADVLAAESRIELLSGDARAAFRRLKKRLLGSRGISSAEVWALLAISAQQVGENEVLETAVERAEGFGVDLGRLMTSRSSGRSSTRDREGIDSRP